MQNEAIVIPPVQNKEAQIVHHETTQKNVGYFMRASVRKTMSQINDVLQDAAIEIAIAKTLYDGCGGYRMMSYGRVSGMSREDLSNYQITIKKRYEAWHGAMRNKNDILLLVKEVCQDERAITLVRYDFRISEKTAFKWLQDGLNEYAMIAGWGNQIEGKLK